MKRLLSAVLCVFIAFMSIAVYADTPTTAVAMYKALLAQGKSPVDAVQAATQAFANSPEQIADLVTVASADTGDPAAMTAAAVSILAVSNNTAAIIAAVHAGMQAAPADKRDAVLIAAAVAVVNATKTSDTATLQLALGAVLSQATSPQQAVAVTTAALKAGLDVLDNEPVIQAVINAAAANNIQVTPSPHWITVTPLGQDSSSPAIGVVPIGTTQHGGGSGTQGSLDSTNNGNTSPDFITGNPPTGGGGNGGGAIASPSQ